MHVPDVHVQQEELADAALARICPPRLGDLGEIGHLRRAVDGQDLLAPDGQVAGIGEELRDVVDELARPGTRS